MKVSTLVRVQLPCTTMNENGMNENGINENGMNENGKVNE
jgi:hypothetical protein